MEQFQRLAKEKKKKRLTAQLFWVLSTTFAIKVLMILDPAKPHS